MKPTDKTGTRRKPTALKVLQGTYRKDRVNPDEPKINPGIPEPPDHLGEVALAEWARITDELYQVGIIAKKDMSVLAAYCQAFEDWVLSSEDCTEKGMTIETTNGNIIQNPAWGVKCRARDAMVKYATEFGMTPSSLSKVSVKEKPKEKSKWEKRG